MSEQFRTDTRSIQQGPYMMSHAYYGIDAPKASCMSCNTNETFPAAAPFGNAMHFLVACVLTALHAVQHFD